MSEIELAKYIQRVVWRDERFTIHVRCAASAPVERDPKAGVFIYTGIDRPVFCGGDGGQLVCRAGCLWVERHMRKELEQAEIRIAQAAILGEL